jgi:hypothetical protein
MQTNWSLTSDSDVMGKFIAKTEKIWQVGKPFEVLEVSMRLV